MRTAPKRREVRTARYLLALAPAEKERMERRAAELGMTLAELLRRGADAYDPERRAA